MKMEQTECSEMLALKLQMTVNNPEESIQHSEHSESLKLIIVLQRLYVIIFCGGDQAVLSAW
jgi:hypothetical protein